jgi:hypothetical protein
MKPRERVIVDSGFLAGFGCHLLVEDQRGDAAAIVTIG